MAQGTTKGVPIDIDETLSQNSDLLVASQKATKSYIDNGLLLKQNVIGYTPVNKGGDTMLGNLILNGNPTLPFQAATKDYIDTLINGIDWKQSAVAGTVASLPSYTVTGSGQVLTGNVNGAIPSATTDGVTLVDGNRVLIKNETSTLAPNNGIYIVTQAGSGSLPFILTRTSDANTPSEIAEATLSVNGGSTLSNTQWHCNPASAPVVIGTTNIVFAQIGSGTYTAGAGLTLSSNVFSIATNGVTDAMIQSATNWNTAYTNRITSLTTTGNSGSATLSSNTLNIPTYTLAGLGGVSSNIYTANGTLTSSRTVTSGGFDLIFNGSNTASGSLSVGLSILHTLIASANNDVLVGLDIGPTFTTGAFTGVTSLALRSRGNIGIFSTGSVNWRYIIGNSTTSYLTSNYEGALYGTTDSTLPYPYNANGHIVLQGRSSADRDILFVNGATPTVQMVLFGASKNISIGNTSDSGYRLDVTGAARVTSSLNIGTTVRQSRILNIRTDSTALNIETDTVDYAFRGAFSTTDGRFRFLIGTSAGPQETITLFQGANVGIGATTDSGFKLDVVGTTRVNNTTATSSTTTGALVVSGGIGVGGSVYIGGNLTTGGLTMGQGITNQNIYLNIQNPGIGYGNGFNFIRGTDSAGIRVIETGSDTTMYEMWMADNPDGGDMMQWRWDDWQNTNGITVPIQSTGKSNRYVAETHSIYGAVYQNPSAFYTTSNFGGTNGADRQLLFNTVGKLRNVGSTVDITVFNVSGYSGTSGNLFWIKLDSTTTFSWGYGSPSGVATVTGIALSTSEITLSNGIKVTFSATTGALGDTFAGRIFRAPLNTFGPTTISGTITATSIVRSGGTSTQYLMADGSTSTLTNPITGTGTSGQVAYWSGTNTQSGSATFTFSPTDQLLLNNSVTAATAIARGANLTPTLVAAANNDVLVGLDINPTFTIGAFTGTTSAAIRVGGNIINNSGFTYSIGTVSNPFANLYCINIISAASLNLASGNITAIYAFQNTRNVLIQNGGTFTDGGQRLQVTGTSYFSGNIGLGIAPTTSQNFIVQASLTGSTSSTGIQSSSQIQSDVTSTARYFHALSRTQNTAFTLSNIVLYEAEQQSLTGPTITNQFGFRVGALTGATNNYGFYGNIAAASNAWNLYMNGTANNYMAGALGIGSTALTTQNFRISKTITSSTAFYNFRNDSQVQSDVTGFAIYNYTASSTAVASFTIADIIHYNAAQGTFGAGSVVTSQTGFLVSASLIGATNNIGFKGSIPSGTNRWNLYMDGTATNYLEGDTAIGTTSLGTATKFTLGGSETAVSAIARGGLINTTLTASANNDVLVGLDVSPTFTVGAFTGVTRAWIRLGTYSTNATTSPANIDLGASYSSVSGQNLKLKLFNSNSGNISDIYGFGVSAGNLDYHSGGSNHSFWGGNTPTQLMKLFGTANLLIQNGGTFTDAGYRLDVNGTARVQGAATFSSSVQGLFFKSTNGTVETVLSYSSTPAGAVGTVTNHPLELYANNAPRVTITTSGNLGLGVTPSAWGTYKAIQVANASLWGAVNNTYIGANYYYNGTNRVYISTGFASEYSQANGQHIWSSAASGTAGNTATITDKMILDASGNLALGVIPSAWSSYGLPVIELPSGGTIVGAGPSATIGANWYYDGSFRYKTSNAATYFIQTSGAFQWFQAASGTAGNAITFTRAMTLDSSGNLGIGTTNPTDKLDVRVAGYGIQHYGDANNILRTYAGGAYQVIVGTNSGIVSEFGYRSGFFYIQTATTERLRITTGGNVLIGTTTDAGYKLDVNGTVRATSSITGAQFYASNTNGISLSDDIANGFLSYGYNSGRTNVASHVFYNGISTELMRITSAGNVGIGTISPTLGKLQIKGGNNNSLFVDNDGSNYTSINIGFNGTQKASIVRDNRVGFERLYVAAEEGYLALLGNSFITFNTGASYTENMRITSGGNLLIGTTTDSGEKLVVSGTSKFSGNSTFTNGSVTLDNTSSSVFLIRSVNTNSNAIILKTSSTSDWFIGQSPLGNAISDLSFYSYGTSSEVLTIAKSTGAATFASSVTASSLIKSGGTSAQILAADGSVITAGTNITISGGTISASGGGSMAIGGGITSATAGSILFAGTSGVLQQDNANLFWDDTNNLLGIGTATPASPIEVYSTSTTYRGISITQASNDTVAAVFTGKKIRGSSAVALNDVLFNFNASGYDGSAYQTGSAIRFVVDSAVTTGSVGTAIEFRTGTSSIGSPRLLMSSTGNITLTGSSFTNRFTAAGRLLIGTTTESTFILDVNGTTRLNGSTTFGTLGSGTGMIWDNTNNRLGIGTATPSYRLDINGTSRFVDASQIEQRLLIKGNNSTGFTGAGLVFSYVITGSGYGQIQAYDYTGAAYKDIVIGGGSKVYLGSVYTGSAANYSVNGALEILAPAPSVNGLILRTPATTDYFYTQYISNTTNRFLLGYHAAPGGFILYNNQTATTSFYVFNGTNNISINSTVDNGYKLDITGTLRATGLITAGAGVAYTRLNPTTTTTTSTATLTPDISVGDMFTITAQAVGLSIANPTGTPVNGQKMTIRIEDNGTARAITWSGTQYRASSDLALPTTTIALKTMYLGFIYNSTDTKWDLIAFINNF